MASKPALLCILFLLAGCARQDADSLARIGRKLAERAGDWIGDVREQLDLGGGDSVQARVTQRLRWEKKLADVAIEVKAQGAEVELCGIVPDHALKLRALELAEATTGVQKVIDNIQVLDFSPTPVPATKENK